MIIVISFFTTTTYQIVGVQYNNTILNSKTNNKQQ